MSASPAPHRVTVLIASHNRRQTTLRCLSALFAAAAEAGAAPTVVLVDDGSTDGTSEAVHAAHPSVKIVRGNGSLFWAGGMRLAQRSAWSDVVASDSVLLLNDDTVLARRGLAQMIGDLHGHNADIVVGRVADPDSGVTTYGGVVRIGKVKRLTVRPVRPGEAVETFNANAVLLDARAFELLGGLGDGYTHAMADFDLGYRARRLNMRVVGSTAVVGTCPRNPVKGTWRDPALSRRERLRRLASPKGLPPREWWRFVRRHGGPLAPAYFFAPYVRILRTPTEGRAGRR